ncbi:MAG: hypothetical protein FWG79_08845 [Bacteroidales bacterium]|nr:hypothetical protein [Bacteroidales bacterium]
MKPKIATWEAIKKEYPDRFVLLENPVFKSITSSHLKEAVLLYKHRDHMKVVEKELELKPHHSTIVYTGGIRLDRINANTLMI